MFLKMQMLD